MALAAIIAGNRGTVVGTVVGIKAEPNVTEFFVEYHISEAKVVNVKFYAFGNIAKGLEQHKTGELVEVSYVAVSMYADELGDWVTNLRALSVNPVDINSYETIYENEKQIREQKGKGRAG